jgi:tetratricopeptide (TPR) repeat protein
LQIRQEPVKIDLFADLPRFSILKELPMRRLDIVLLALAILPNVVQAQQKSIILTDKVELKITDEKGEPALIREDLGGYLVENRVNGAWGKTWYGANIRFNQPAGVPPMKEISRLSDYIDGNSCEATFYKYRGIAWRFAGKYDIAIEDFTESLRLDPAQADVYTHRGYTYHLKYRPSILFHLARNMGLLFMGNAMGIAVAPFTVHLPFEDFLKTDADRARDDFDRALRIKPDSGWTYFSRTQVPLEKWLARQQELNDEKTKHEAATLEKDRDKKAWDDAKTEYEDAKKDLARKKQAFLQAQTAAAERKKKLDEAGKDDTEAKTRYDVANNKRETKYNEFESAQEKVAEKKKTLDDARAKLAEAGEKLCTASAILTEAKNDLQEAIEDLDKALRYEQRAAKFLTEQRQRAKSLMDIAKVAKEDDCLSEVSSREEDPCKAKKPKAAVAPVAVQTPVEVQVELKKPIVVTVEWPKDPIKIQLPDSIKVTVQSEKTLTPVPTPPSSTQCKCLVIGLIIGLVLIVIVAAVVCFLTCSGPRSPVTNPPAAPVPAPTWSSAPTPAPTTTPTPAPPATPTPVPPASETGSEKAGS